MTTKNDVTQERHGVSLPVRRLTIGLLTALLIVFAVPIHAGKIVTIDSPHTDSAYGNSEDESGEYPDADPNGNTLNINADGNVSGSAYGAFTWSVDATNNTVNITGGTVVQSVWGSFVASVGNAIDNAVNINGGTVEGHVFGGFTVSGDATGNIVDITGGTIIATGGSHAAGIGGGYMLGEYSIGTFVQPIRILAANFLVGFNFWNWFDVSYTLRTDFATVSNKFAVGFSYRFRE